ncbi:hypothetical protein [Fervidicola ferrireducens]|jgi:hypothetical protein|uniref:hypothetical protein n=1 Tax=Fervidicola ferrireducens TaxID=520764 RepID=UPI001FDFEB7F|nr:hypothetical protein [Fervidicola ferrireducens]
MKPELEEHYPLRKAVEILGVHPITLRRPPSTRAFHRPNRPVRETWSARESGWKNIAAPGATI